MITSAQNPFERLMGQYSTDHWLRERERHETDECVCDSGAILSDRQRGAGRGAADGEMGAGDWASLLSLCL